MSDYMQTVLDELLRLGFSEAEIEVRRDVNEHGLALFFVEDALPGLALEVAVGRSGDCYLAIDQMLQLEFDLSSAPGAERFALALRLAARFGISLYQRGALHWVVLGAPDALPEQDQGRLARLDLLHTWPPRSQGAVPHAAMLSRGLPPRSGTRA